MPPATHAEALASHRDAVAAEPLPERVGRQATLMEAEELAALVQAIYAADTEQDRAEAMQAALADPDGALRCYRAIADERGIVIGAPERQAAIRQQPNTCTTCQYGRRPDGHALLCAAHDDLQSRYGAHHPLNRLPDDGGASCSRYLPHV
jgi:hypothetical protein